MYDVSCILLSKVYIRDLEGNIVIENGREKFGIKKIQVPIISVERVWKDEFYKANSQGLRPSLRIKMNVLNYNDEQEVIYKNEEYTIIRVDGTNSIDEIVLICQKRANNVK